MTSPKTKVLSFKLEPELASLVEGIANKSEFIRIAILGALQFTCPLCQGRGSLSPAGLDHWRFFTRSHSLKTCTTCASPYVHCGQSPTEKAKLVHKKSSQGRT